jgi:hypothetical protein
MDSDTNLLGKIRIASPCTASWDDMRGDDRVRFCQHCRLNVYNLSAMTRQEAEALIREKEGRLCIRFYARRDGTVLTDNCPVGLRAVRRALLAQASYITSAYAAVCSLALLLTSAGRQTVRNTWLGRKEPSRTIIKRPDTAPTRHWTKGSPPPEPVRMGKFVSVPAQRKPVMGEYPLTEPPSTKSGADAQ